MITNVINSCLPSTWTNVGYYSSDYTLEDIPMHSHEYNHLKARVTGSFNMSTKNIVRVQNPYLYAQYLLKKEEYETLGNVRVLELYHDTAAWKIASIVSENLDWRLANRVKYGKGVSFSPFPAYANQESSRNNGTDRAMIIADVLIGRAEAVAGCRELPTNGYDTTVGNGNKVYVKYYDNEFYPKFIVYYESRPHVFRPRRRYW